MALNGKLHSVTELLLLSIEQIRNYYKARKEDQKTTCLVFGFLVVQSRSASLIDMLVLFL